MYLKVEGNDDVLEEDVDKVSDEQFREFLIKLSRDLSNTADTIPCYAKNDKRLEKTLNSVSKMCYSTGALLDIVEYLVSKQKEEDPRMIDYIVRAMNAAITISKEN
jgi:hypothetical protein